MIYQTCGLDKKEVTFGRQKLLLFLVEARGICPGYRPIASLRSLPRRPKQSPGLFSSASLPPCSIPLFFSPQKINNTREGCCSFFGGGEGNLSGLSPYRLASLVAASAKTVPRTVFFRFAPSLFDSPLLFSEKNKQHPRGVLFIFWWRRGESNPCPKTCSSDFLRVHPSF